MHLNLVCAVHSLFVSLHARAWIVFCCWENHAHLIFIFHLPFVGLHDVFKSICKHKAHEIKIEIKRLFEHKTTNALCYELESESIVMDAAAVVDVIVICECVLHINMTQFFIWNLYNSILMLTNAFNETFLFFFISHLRSYINSLIFSVVAFSLPIVVFISKPLNDVQREYTIQIKNITQILASIDVWMSNENRKP